LLTTQLHILLSTIKEGSLDTQRRKIKKLLDDSGVEMSAVYLARLLQTNAATIFSGAPKNRDSYTILCEEVEKLTHVPEQAENFSQAFDADFDLAAFFQHFSLEAPPKTSLLTSLRIASVKPELRAEGTLLLRPITCGTP
jgi:hypothetical protein